MKKTLKIRIVLTMFMMLSISGAFAINALAEAVESLDNFAVVVKENGLWAVSVSKVGNEVSLDKSGTFKAIKISPDGRNVAYIKDEILYIAVIDLSKGEKKVTEVSKKVISYAWGSNNNLVYSTEIGGLNGFDLKTRKSTAYIKSENHYEGIQIDGFGKVYGQLLRYYMKNGSQYVKDKGVVSFDLTSEKEKLIIPSIPISDKKQDLGFMPQVAGISKDGAFVYVWCKVHSASINTDGVQFGVYEVKSNKFIQYGAEKMFALAYSDNLAINPKDGRLPVINNGGIRNMNINKTLGILDMSKDTFNNILPDYMIDSGRLSMVTMTPAFSPDAKKIIFSASYANENLQQWEKEPHNIYTVDIKSKKVEKITKGKTFDFTPMYLSKVGEIVFARREDENNISLWRLKGNKEECITTKIKLGEYSWFYGHYNLENSLAVYVHKI